MARKKIRLERITDEKLKQATFIKRKNALLRKAMELSVLCECDVAVIIFGAGTNKLVQYSSTGMENILERYSTACQQPHERRTHEELLKLYYTDLNAKKDDENGFDMDEDGKGDGRSRKRQRSLEELTRKILRPGSPTLSDGSVSSMSEGSLLGAGAADVLKPLGLAIDRRIFPVSPKSERAFESITVEFDKLLEQMRQVQEQVAAGEQQTLNSRPNGTARSSMPIASNPLVEAATLLSQPSAAEEPASSMPVTLPPIPALTSGLPALETTNSIPPMQAAPQPVLPALGLSAAVQSQPMQGNHIASGTLHNHSEAMGKNTVAQHGTGPSPTFVVSSSLPASSAPTPALAVNAPASASFQLPSSSMPTSNTSQPDSSMPGSNTTATYKGLQALNTPLQTRTEPPSNWRTLTSNAPGLVVSSSPSNAVAAAGVSLAASMPAPFTSFPPGSAPAPSRSLPLSTLPAPHMSAPPGILPGSNISLPSSSTPAPYTSLPPSGMPAPNASFPSSNPHAPSVALLPGSLPSGILQSNSVPGAPLSGPSRVSPPAQVSFPHSGAPTSILSLPVVSAPLLRPLEGHPPVTLSSSAVSAPALPLPTVSPQVNAAPQAGALPQVTLPANGMQIGGPAAAATAMLPTMMPAGQQDAAMSEAQAFQPPATQ